MPKQGMLIALLVIGIAVLGIGLFAKLGSAYIGTPGTTQDLKHDITYQEVTWECDQGCRVVRGPNIPIGEYIGGFMTAWRDCYRWVLDGAGPNLKCDDWIYDAYTGGITKGVTDGTFTSLFGILEREESGQFFLLFPLYGQHIEDYPDSQIPSDVRIPVGWTNRMLWTKWRVTVDAQGAYSYVWDGYVGGGCIGQEDPDDLCGRVVIEHGFYFPGML